MAKPLIVNLAGVDFPLNLNKVERSDLYGYIEIETQDEQGRRCTTATLADDGRTIIATSGTAFASLSPDGEWLDKKSLLAVDTQGKTISPVPSSYSAPVPLAKTATIDEYLSHNIRGVYEVSSDIDLAPLMAELKKGVIFHFPYSYRGGLEPDAGFLLLAADGTPFIAIGSPTRLEMVSMQQPAAIAEPEADAEDDDSLDFSMM